MKHQTHTNLQLQDIIKNRTHTVVKLYSHKKVSSWLWWNEQKANPKKARDDQNSYIYYLWHHHSLPEKRLIKILIFPYTVFVCLYMEVICPNTVKYGTVFRRFFALWISLVFVHITLFRSSELWLIGLLLYLSIFLIDVVILKFFKW